MSINTDQQIVLSLQIYFEKGCSKISSGYDRFKAAGRIRWLVSYASPKANLRFGVGAVSCAQKKKGREKNVRKKKIKRKKKKESLKSTLFVYALR